MLLLNNGKKAFKDDSLPIPQPITASDEGRVMKVFEDQKIKPSDDIRIANFKINSIVTNPHVISLNIGEIEQPGSWVSFSWVLPY